MTLPPRIGRYEVQGEIGAGGFATVYLAYDPVLDRRLAIKVLHAHLARDERIRERFLREGKALARIHHPNLVQVHDAGIAEGRVFLAMEFIPGRSLAEIADTWPMPVERVVSVIRQVAGALDTVHAARLVHRDIKPANILLTPDGRAVLLDLGIAQAQEGTQLTTSGMILGTPGFLAPEQIASSTPITPRTDVYQLGATAYTLLAGRPPFVGDTAQVLYAVVHHAPPDLAEARPDLPPHIIAAVAEALAKDPVRRPVSAGAFAWALADLTTAAPTPADWEAPTQASGPGATRGDVSSPGRTHPSGSAHGQTRDGSTPVPRRLGAARGMDTASLGRRRAPPPAALLAVAAGLVLLLVGVALVIRDREEEARGSAASDGVGTGAAAGRSGEPRADVASARPRRDCPDGEDALAADCATLALSFAANEKLHRTFAGRAGQRLSLGVSPPMPSDATLEVSILGPDGKRLMSGTVYESGRDFDLPPLPADGSYTVSVSAKRAGRTSLTLSIVLEQTIALNGPPLTLTLDRPGQNARVTFAGTAGQRIAIAGTRMRFGDGGVEVSLFSPETATAESKRLAGKNLYSDGGDLDPPPLPLTGAYAILVNPGLHTGSMTLTLSTDLEGQIQVDGPAAAVAIERPGQNARLTFRGTAGQRLGLGITRVKVGIGGDERVEVTVLTPDGARLTTKNAYQDGAALAIPPLPVTGAYAIVVHTDIQTGELQLLLSSELSLTLPTDGSATAITISRSGQYARGTFEGITGRRAVLVAARVNVGLNACCAAEITVLGPDGAKVASRNAYRDGVAIEIAALPATGTYTVVVSPGVNTGSLTLALTLP